MRGPRRPEDFVSALPSASLTRLFETHDRVQEAFALHQEALLDLDLQAARLHLETHAEILRAHIREEEVLLLPVYGERTPEAPGGRVAQFTAEHRHLEEMVRGLAGDVAALSLGEPALRRKVIAIFDREALYKHLLDHHDRRERNVLYPVLDRVTSSEERERMLAGCVTIARCATAIEREGPDS